MFFCLSFVFRVYVVFWFLVFGCQYQCSRLPGKSRLRNDRLCVEWDAKPYTLTHSVLIDLIAFLLWVNYFHFKPPAPPLDNIRAVVIVVIVWRLRWNIIKTALCWIVWHSVYSQQHTYMSSSYRSNRLGLSRWDPYTVHRGGCLELYYCNMVEWFLWDLSLISTTNWFPSVLWHCWLNLYTTTTFILNVYVILLLQV